MIKAHLQIDGSGAALRVSGHAGSGPYGHDLVCAAVSGIVLGGINALEGEKDFRLKVDEGLVELTYVREPSSRDRFVLETIWTQLESIDESHPGFIKLERKY